MDVLRGLKGSSRLDSHNTSCHAHVMHTLSGVPVEVVADVVVVAAKEEEEDEEEGAAPGHSPSTARFAIPWMCGSSSRDRASRDVVRSIPAASHRGTRHHTTRYIYVKSCHARIISGGKYILRTPYMICRVASTMSRHIMPLFPRHIMPRWYSVRVSQQIIPESKRRRDTGCR